MDATSHEGTSADLRILYSLRPVTMVRGFTGVGRDDGANLNCSYLLGTMHGIQSCSDTMSCRRSRGSLQPGSIPASRWSQAD